MWVCYVCCAFIACQYKYHTHRHIAYIYIIVGLYVYEWFVYVGLMFHCVYGLFLCILYICMCYAMFVTTCTNTNIAYSCTIVGMHAYERFVYVGGVSVMYVWRKWKECVLCLLCVVLSVNINASHIQLMHIDTHIIVGMYVYEICLCVCCWWCCECNSCMCIMWYVWCMLCCVIMCCIVSHTHTEIIIGMKVCEWFVCMLVGGVNVCMCYVCESVCYVVCCIVSQYKYNATNQRTKMCCNSGFANASDLVVFVLCVNNVMHVLCMWVCYVRYVLYCQCTHIYIALTQCKQLHT